MTASLNVNELIEEVRSQIDEPNEVSIETSHILQAMNRAQRSITRILARRIDHIFLDVFEVNTNDGVIGQDGTMEFDMPAGTFGRRIEKMELRQQNSAILWRVHHISYKNRDPFVTNSQVTRPYYYDIVGNKLRVYPVARGGQTIFLHYSKTPSRLVEGQGQINSTNIANNYVIVDSVGDDLSEESDLRNSYVNIVDNVTGAIKVSLQIAFIDTGIGQIKFKSSGLTRDTVLGQTISTAIPTTVSEDDHVCLVKGTAVPQVPDAFADYLVQHTVVALKRRIREPSQEDFLELQRIEEQIKKEIQGREQSQRIRKANSHFGRPLGGALRRYFS
jgi:hypothetical protein